MYETLSDKKIEPTMEIFVAHIGTNKKSFEKIDDYLINEINSAKNVLKWDVHCKGWAVSYYIKKKYICTIISEKNSFKIVTRLPESSINEIYENILPYTKECIDNSPFRHGGWIEYRILKAEHLKDAKKLLQIRASIMLTQKIPFYKQVN